MCLCALPGDINCAKRMHHTLGVRSSFPLTTAFHPGALTTVATRHTPYNTCYNPSILEGTNGAYKWFRLDRLTGTKKRMFRWGKWAGGDTHLRLLKSSSDDQVSLWICITTREEYDTNVLTRKESFRLRSTSFACFWCDQCVDTNLRRVDSFVAFFLIFLLKMSIFCGGVYYSFKIKGKHKMADFLTKTTL